MSLNSCCIAMVAVLASLANDAALASSKVFEAPLEERVREAELIVRGTVVAVETRLSDPDPQNPNPLPHTFVTYRVERVLKGAVANEEFTLRFIGGPIDDDRYMTASGVPLFDVGDRDVLLARSNLASECPLVDCASGRFRMVEEMLVSEEGRRFQITDDGQIAEGPAMKLDAINTNRMSDTIALERIEIPPPGQVILDPRDPAVRAGIDPLRDFTPDGFVNYLEAVVKAAHTPEELERSARTPMPSADPRVRFAAWSAPDEPAVVRPEEARTPSLAATLPGFPRTPAPTASAGMRAIDRDDVASDARPMDRSDGPGVRWVLAFAAVIASMAAGTALRWAKRMSRASKMPGAR
jgi:hypothetical protein